MRGLQLSGLTALCARNPPSTIKSSPPPIFDDHYLSHVGCCYYYRSIATANITVLADQNERRLPTRDSTTRLILQFARSSQMIGLGQRELKPLSILITISGRTHPPSFQGLSTPIPFTRRCRACVHHRTLSYLLILGFSLALYSWLCKNYIPIGGNTSAIVYRYVWISCRMTTRAPWHYLLEGIWSFGIRMWSDLAI